MNDDWGLREEAPARDFYRAALGPTGKNLPDTPNPRQPPWHWFLRRWLLCRALPEPVPSQLGTVEPPEAGKLGICCSGGGIRSAAFSLGALQVLREQGELSRASYLAAVSGGSYIAGALSMVATPGPDGSDELLLQRMPPFAPGSPEEQYLRNRASYLAPTLVDKIYLGWRVVLGLVVNLIFLSLPLIGLALLLSGLLLASQIPGLAGSAAEPCKEIAAHTAGFCSEEPTWHLPSGFWIAPVALLGASALCGFITLLVRWTVDRRERFFRVWSVRLLILAAVAAAIFVVLPFLAAWMREQIVTGSATSASKKGSNTGVGLGALALLAGVATQLGHLLSSSDSEEGGKLGTAHKLFAKLGKGARIAITYAAAAVVGPLLLFWIFALSATVGLADAEPYGRVDVGVTAVGFAFVLAFVLAYVLVDLSTWSLNPYYKRRLSSAFALRRISALALKNEPNALRKRVEARLPSDPERDVGIAVERNYDDPVPLSETELKGGNERPTLLVCAAANISDTAATPPGRGVTSFTFSPHTVGGPLVGAVETSEMENLFESQTARWGTRNVNRRRQCDLTLPAAMAMSGAAISPSMGKMTRHPLTFLMALANIRLGVWIPNPRWIGEFDINDRLRERHRKPRPSYLLRELFGRNNVGAKYLYVTDGGHYENLGLVELLRRGCLDVYCLDASGVGRDGARFEALGEAISLARSELGVKIEFEPGSETSDPEKLVPDAETQISPRDVITAKITYPPGPDGGPGPTGRLVYVRNAMTAAVPLDVRAHHEADRRFPDNPTVDQLYTDQKFEAYRVLGARAASTAVEALKSAHTRSARDAVCQHLSRWRSSTMPT